MRKLQLAEPQFTIDGQSQNANPNFEEKAGSEISLKNERERHSYKNDFSDSDLSNQRDHESMDLAKEIALVKEDNEKKLKAKIESLETKLEKTEHALHTFELENNSLQNDLENALSDLQFKNKILEDFEKKGKTLNDESLKFLNQIKQVNEKNNRLQKKNVELLENIQENKKQQVQKDREIENIKRENIKNESENLAKSKKIEQLLEDISKIKNTYKTQKVTKESANEFDSKKTEKLIFENKKLEKQKNDLLAILKKQTSLIDVLKKQKVNIQSAYLSVKKSENNRG